MSKVPAELKYVSSHEWLRVEADGTVTIGITDHAQQALGDLVFVEVPAVGRKVAANEACAVVESVKAASDVYAPAGGEVVEGNAAVADDHPSQGLRPPGPHHGEADRVPPGRDSRSRPVACALRRRSASRRSQLDRRGGRASCVTRRWSPCPAAAIPLLHEPADRDE